MFAYIVQNQINGKVYIGKTEVAVNQRLHTHKWLADHGRGYYFHNAIRKHGFDNFLVTEVCSASNPQELIEIEKFLIAVFRSDSSDFGYNLTPGGEGGTFNEAARKKLSNAMRGRTYPNRNRKGIPRPNLSGDKHPMWGTHPVAWNKGLKTGPNPKHSEFMKGRTPWNKGKKTGYNAKHAEAMRGHQPWNKGRSMGEEFREKCRAREANFKIVGQPSKKGRRKKAAA